MSTKDIFGLKNMPHAEASRQIASLFQLKFELRESSYVGEYDLFRGRDGESFKLVHNVGDPDEDMLHPEYPDYPVIFQVYRPTRDEELHERLLAGIPGLVHLTAHPAPPDL